MRRDVALIILYDRDKRVLLQHRSVDAPRLPDHWAFFGGGIEEGETPLAAVTREATEELGYELQGPKLVMTQKYSDDDTFGTKYVFMEAYDSSQQPVLKEGQDMGWFSIPDTRRLKIVWHDRNVLVTLEKKY